MPELLKLKCLHKFRDGTVCKHVWTPTTEKPVCCPACKSYIDWEHPDQCIEIIKNEEKK